MPACEHGRSERGSRRQIQGEQIRVLRDGYRLTAGRVSHAGCRIAVARFQAALSRSPAASWKAGRTTGSHRLRWRIEPRRGSASRVPQAGAAQQVAFPKRMLSVPAARRYSPTDFSSIATASRHEGWRRRGRTRCRRLSQHSATEQCTLTARQTTSGVLTPAASLVPRHPTPDFGLYLWQLLSASRLGIPRRTSGLYLWQLLLASCLGIQCRKVSLCHDHDVPAQCIGTRCWAAVHQLRVSRIGTTAVSQSGIESRDAPLKSLPLRRQRVPVSQCLVSVSGCRDWPPTRLHGSCSSRRSFPRRQGGVAIRSLAWILLVPSDGFGQWGAVSLSETVRIASE